MSSATSRWDCFTFSIETLATVGYGGMHPQTNYGHMIAIVEIFTGMCFLAVPVVTVHQDQPTLMMLLRALATISQATARLWLFRVETTLKGYEFRRYHELLLDRHEHPTFTLSWSVFHTIEKPAPLFRMTAADLAAVDGSLALNSAGSTAVPPSSFLRAGSTRTMRFGGTTATSILTVSRKQAG